MADDDERLEEGALTAEEILVFGPCVEAQTWTPVWIQEARAPIAVAAGRPRFGPIFNSDGVGNAVLIRPCMSRGRRLRGLPPVYTPRMLEANSTVFDGWPMFTDHVPPELVATLAKHGRSVKELAGQVLKGRWQRDYVHEDDRQYGYQKGATIAEVWATPFMRSTVGNNPGLLHTSINAWPTSGKPGPVPWRPAMKGMLIEGIRRQPQGSVDYVVRGGAGGRLLVAEGLEEEGAWPEIGEWSDTDKRLVVSLAESFYASGAMELELPTKPSELRDWLAEHAPHLVPALAEDTNGDGGTKPKPTTTTTTPPAAGTAADATVAERMTRADVEAIMRESMSGMPSVEEFETQLQERTERMLAEREGQRSLSEIACALIESAEGVPPTWKKDLKARYSLLPSGAPVALQVQEDDNGENGAHRSERQVLEARVADDLKHVRDLIAEATGKPRVKGEGGAARGAGGDAERGSSSRQRGAGGGFFRQRMVQMGLAESEEKVVEIFGGKVQDAA